MLISRVLIATMVWSSVDPVAEAMHRSLSLNRGLNVWMVNVINYMYISTDFSAFHLLSGSNMI